MPTLSNNVLEKDSFFPDNILNNIFKNIQKEDVLKNYFGDSNKINVAFLWQEYKFINFISLKESSSKEKSYLADDGGIDTKQIYLSVKSVLSNINNTDASEGIIFEKYRYLNPVNSSRNKTGILENYARSQPATESESTVIRAESDRQITQVNRAFELIGLTKLRNHPKFSDIDGSGFNVAVIDTGIDMKHPLLASNYVAGYDFVDDDDDPRDPNGHGTHVSGIIAATDKTIGVAPDAGLIGLRVIDSDGSGYISAIEDALKWVFINRRQHHITAVNLSLGTGFYSSESQVRGNRLFDDIQRLEDAGITVVSSTGNNYFTHCKYITTG